MVFSVRIAAVCTAAALLVGAAPLAEASAPRLPAPTTSRHYVSNLDGSTAPKRWGFNIFDTGSSSRQINALPRGVRALVYLGQDCPTPADAAFKATIDRLAKNRRVYGYYLSDEPSIAGCPQGPANLASRTTYIRRASGGRQKSFIVLLHSENLRAYRPAVSRVDLVGIDPYPCSVSTPQCALWKINQDVGRARRAGIPLAAIVPVYQAFGQNRTSDHYYNLPTARQMRAMLRRWASLVPHPQFDYAYSWGHQRSANPTLRDSLPLKRVFRAYFAR